MSKEKILKFMDKHFIVLWGIVIGIIMFLIIYGPSTLNVSYDSWIYSGYMEDDIQQHYAGWTHFRNSKWAFPLGKAENLTYPDGTIISYTDSIPFVAITLKLFRNFLPETFQFFGIYVLVCFILQAISSSMLIGLFTKNKKHIMIGSILFVMSPIMIERAFRHTSLASHWLILFALYLYFKHRQGNYDGFKWQFLIISALAIATHPYYLPMCMGILFADYLETIINKKNYLKATGFLVLNIVIAVIVGVIIGAIAGETALGDSGYGFYNMNLNALINPDSIGMTTWSAFLRPRGQTIGNYDGFNYLGLSVIIAGMFITLNYILTNGIKYGFAKILKTLKSHIGLTIVAVILTLFAISNVITLGAKVILEIPIPEFLKRLCTIFRASGRMFYPVFYLIFLAEEVYILRNFNEKNITILLTCLVVFQFIDLSPAFVEKNRYFSNTIEQTVFTDDIWKRIANSEEMVMRLEEIDENDLNKRYLAMFAGKNGIKINIDVKSRERDTALYKKETDRVYTGLLEGKNSLGNSLVFITDNNDLFMYAKNNLNEELEFYEDGMYKIILPKALKEKTRQ